jgi:predicted Zn-dependent peptidase
MNLLRCYIAGWLACTLMATGCSGASPEEAKVEMQSLANGIRVVSIQFPTSTNVSIFTFLPLGLTSDGPGQAQWSHLVEHLVIRSTSAAGPGDTNAETLPDHMRLDFYGHMGNWREGLRRHRQWIEGVPFTEAVLAEEKPKVIAECEFTARNFTTHKFAVAAWSQGMRHGSKHVGLKSDVTNARLAGVQRLRDEHLAVSNRVTVCIVGGIDAAQAFEEAEKQLGALPLAGAAVPPAKLVTGELDLTWDLDARHLLLTWPIPDHRSADHAALMVAAQCLNMQMFANPELNRVCGMTLAGCDLATPEGTFFFISASLRPEADFEDVRALLLAAVEQLAADSSTPVSMIGRQLADSLTRIPDPQALKAQMPTHVSLAMIEGNLGLQFGMHEHRYGNRRAPLAKQIAETSTDQMLEAIRKHLRPAKAVVCTLRPEAASAEKSN